jgi:hypothetical protein
MSSPLPVAPWTPILPLYRKDAPHLRPHASSTPALNRLPHPINALTQLWRCPVWPAHGNYAICPGRATTAAPLTRCARQPVNESACIVRFSSYDPIFVCLSCRPGLGTPLLQLMAHRECVSGAGGTRPSLLYLYPSEPLAAASFLPQLGLAMAKPRRSHRLVLFLSSKRVRASTAPASPGHELLSVLKGRCTNNFRCCSPCTHPAKRAATDIYSPIAKNPPLSPGVCNDFTPVLHSTCSCASTSTHKSCLSFIIFQCGRIIRVAHASDPLGAPAHS